VIPTPLPKISNMQTRSQTRTWRCRLVADLTILWITGRFAWRALACTSGTRRTVRWNIPRQTAPQRAHAALFYTARARYACLQARSVPAPGRAHGNVCVTFHATLVHLARTRRLSPLFPPAIGAVATISRQRRLWLYISNAPGAITLGQTRHDKISRRKLMGGGGFMAIVPNTAMERGHLARAFNGCIPSVRYPAHFRHSQPACSTCHLPSTGWQTHLLSAAFSLLHSSLGGETSPRAGIVRRLQQRLWLLPVRHRRCHAWHLLLGELQLQPLWATYAAAARGTRCGTYRPRARLHSRPLPTRFLAR